MFSDVVDGFWATDAIQTALAEGWVRGYEDGTFKPMQNISRVETVTIINRMLNRNVCDDIVPKVWIPVVDLDTTHWGYANVLEAITAHEYERDEEGYEVWSKYRYPFHEDMSEDAYNDV